MSKPVKELVRKELTKRFDGVNSLAVVSFTGIDAVTTHQIRGQLREKQIQFTVVKNSIARQAFAAMGLEAAKMLIDGPCAIAYGVDPDKVEIVKVVRELVNIGKETPNLTVKAAVLDGEAFGPDRIEEFCKFPTRDEAVAKATASLLSAGARVVGAVIGPASRIANLLKAVQEKRESEAGGEKAA